MSRITSRTQARKVVKPGRKSTPKVSTPEHRSNRRFTLAAALALGMLIVVAGVWMSGGGRPGNSTAGISIRYSTEEGEGASEGTINSPLTALLQLPPVVRSVQYPVMNASILFVDEAGNPATFGGKAQEPSIMAPALESDSWLFRGSVPSVPGSYHARITIRTAEEGAEPRTLDLFEPRLVVKTESGPRLTSGYVFVSDADLWVLSTDAKKERRLTFFDPRNEHADSPRWSPDGKAIVFSYWRRSDANQMPAAAIWTIGTDGEEPWEVIAPGPDQALLFPTWSSDGDYIYFTVESGTATSNAYDANQVLVGERHIEKLDVATGVRSHVVDSAQEIANGSPTGELLCLEEVRTEQPLGAFEVKQRLVRLASAGRSERVVVDEHKFMKIDAPHVSPDGKWVAFTAINSDATGEKGIDFFRALLEPSVAYAHGFPSDIYVVPSDGGAEPTRLTRLNEDDPYPVWLDDSTVAVMGATGLYRVGVDGAGKATGEIEKIHAGVRPGKLTWHAP